jgi:hypothetical protein
MVRTTVNLLITVEEKDGDTGEGVHPALPAIGDVAFHLADRVADDTKHDGRLGWRVVGVEEVG